MVNFIVFLFYIIKLLVYNNGVGGVKLNLETKIKMAMTYKNVSQSKLAKLIGTSPQNFNKKLKRQTFSPEELNKIANALGAEYESYFIFEDGTKI